MLLAILGRQPKLGLAELESVCSAAAVRPIGEAALVDAPALDHQQLGGTLKIAAVLDELPVTDWRRLASETANRLPALLAGLPDGKVTIGLSVYGLAVRSQELFRTGLDLKKISRAAGRGARIVPNSAPALNSAQILYNQLTGNQGLELLFVRDGHKTWLARTLSVQDIDAYARRDHGRPKRDAFVGMLPPKLAQIMLNLAQVVPGQRVLDPFCGTGVILQEAALRGCVPYGTDLDARMVDFTRQNMEWLAQTHHVTFDLVCEQADATIATWQKPLDHVVCETYLGQPLSGLPKPAKLAEITGNCNVITSKFLRNLRPQLAAGTRLCIAVPVWRVGGRFKHLGLLDDLENLGYNRLRLQHASSGDLIYHREDQIVGRELLVLTVK